MKLKILFFPLILIASVSIFIVYIWPETKNLKITAAENEKSMQALDLIKSKKEVIRKLDQELGKNSEKEEFVKKYLADKRNEERIINAVNSLATSSSTSLVDLSVEEERELVSNMSEPAYPSSQLFSPTSGSEVPIADAPVITEIPVNLQSVAVKITIAGKYESIKAFMVGLNKLGLMNNIEVVRVFADESSKEAEEGSASNEILSAEIDGRFYYLKGIKAQNNFNLKVLNFDKFDFSQVEKIKQYISQETVKLEVGEKGRVNPFLLQ